MQSTNRKPWRSIVVISSDVWNEFSSLVCWSPTVLATHTGSSNAVIHLMEWLKGQLSNGFALVLLYSKIVIINTALNKYSIILLFWHVSFAFKSYCTDIFVIALYNSEARSRFWWQDEIFSKESTGSDDIWRNVSYIGWRNDAFCCSGGTCCLLQLDQQVNHFALICQLFIY